MTKPKPVTVVGGGWAGLTAAIELVRHDIPVVLLESAKQLGGRARRVPFDNNINLDQTDNDELKTSNGDNTDKISVDNGQHLLIGAYDSTLTVLRTIGVSEESVLKRENLVLNMRRRNKRNVRIKTGRLPAPLHLAWGLLFASGLSLTDRTRALQFCRTLQKANFTVPSDESCLELFKRNRQTEAVIKILWEPLCVAALNTPIATASATVFLRVLREAFSYTRSESDLLFTDLAEQLDKLGTQPIVTIYLQYPEHITLNATMIGLVDTTAQWIFDRRIYGQPGLMSVVISSSGPHMDMDNKQLCETVEQEVASFFPAWPKPSGRMVIREKRATFDCISNSNDYRPGNETGLPGLWLAGDYTDTKLPATLESAVRSGKRCAKAIIKVIHQSGDNN